MKLTQENNATLFSDVSMADHNLQKIEATIAAPVVYRPGINNSYQLGVLKHNVS